MPAPCLLGRREEAQRAAHSPSHLPSRWGRGKDNAGAGAGQGGLPGLGGGGDRTALRAQAQPLGGQDPVRVVPWEPQYTVILYIWPDAAIRERAFQRGRVLVANGAAWAEATVLCSLPG